jgi:hypothetical protein
MDLEVHKMQTTNITDNKRALFWDFEAMAWGVFFVWWGVLELFPGLPEGSGAVGIGLILLAMNAARAWQGMPTSGFTLTLGSLALLWGILELANTIIVLPFELPTFAILLIALGLIVLGRALLRSVGE